MNSQIIPFKGGNIEAIKHTDGKIYVSVRRVCDHLGISNSTQYRKLVEAKWSCITTMNTHDSNGRIQEQVFIPADSLAIWMVTIHSGKVSSQCRPLIEAYQEEAKQVLAQHFTPAVASAPKQSDLIRSMLHAAEQYEALEERTTKIEKGLEEVKARQPLAIKTYKLSFDVLRTQLHSAIQNCGKGLAEIKQINKEIRNKTCRKRENYELHHYVIAANILQQHGVACQDLLEALKSKTPIKA